MALVPCMCLFALVASLAIGAPINENENVAEVEQDLFEGDIILPKKRNGHPATALRWPKGVIPYVISSSVSRKGKSIIKKAISYYADKTCIRLVKRTNQRDYVKFQSKSNGCFSTIGKASGGQILNLAPDYFNAFGTVLHEIMHAVGFYHEQAREDRVHYVNIHWENIILEKKDQFDIAKGSLTYGTKYDLSSVMHYSSKAFTKNGKETITPKSGKASQLFQRNKLSSTDLYKIRAMYKCN